MRKERSSFQLLLLVSLVCVFVPGGARAGGSGGSRGWRFEVKRGGASEEKAALLKDELTSNKNRFGAAILEVRLKGETVFTASKKMADRNTVFPIASGSKWLTAATVMRLVDEGLLSLDDPVSDYLPRFKAKKSKITVRHLLSHTSGLPEVEPRKGAWAEGSGTYCARVAHSRLEAEPGTAFRYGNTSFRVVKRVAEVAAGQQWEEIFQSRVGRPLDLDRTSFKGAPGRGFRGPVSSAADYAVYMEAFVRSLEGKDGAFWSRRAARQMLEDHSAGKAVSRRGRLLREGHHEDGYGLGVWIQFEDEKRERPRVISHYGSSGFRAAFDLKTGVSEVFLTKKKPRTRKWLRRRLERVISAAWRFGESADNIAD